jgi:hypothetical protein
MLASFPLLVLARKFVFPSGYSPVLFFFLLLLFLLLCSLYWIRIRALEAEHNDKETNVRLG